MVLKSFFFYHYQQVILIAQIGCTRYVYLCIVINDKDNVWGEFPAPSGCIFIMPFSTPVAMMQKLRLNAGKVQTLLYEDLFEE